MQISYRWLERHVDLSGITPEELASDLTLSTAEVEGTERFAPHLSDVVVGRVVERADHPNAERLSSCQVDVGGDAPLGIVCGAPNVAAGQKVAVAQVGTVLPGDFKIKKSKIRGIESRGMICSVRELELGDEHDGIWVLPEDAAVGEPVAKALGIEDTIIEIDNKSLTHRPDLWGHRGIAREVAAIYRRDLRPLDTTLPNTGDADRYPVRVDSSACSRYLGLLIEGARAEASPQWLQWLLLAVGQRPIDVLVDLSNFVMLDLGQPNHTFDAESLTALGAEGIVVRNARDGETIATLDGEERELIDRDLLICAGEKPVALAGIMGGARSKVGLDTRRLLLEVATFDAPTVRRTSSRLGLRTDASSRFEKCLDPTLPLQAAGHFARLLQSIQPDVRLPAPISDAGDWTDPATEISLRSTRVRAAIANEVSDNEIVDILERLQLRVSGSDGVYSVSIPSARATKDLTLEQDLIEEVGRIYRYGNIPEQAMLAEVVPPPRDPRRELVRRLQDRLAGTANFHEVLSYSFLPDEVIEKLDQRDQPYVRVSNPPAKNESHVRRSVLPSLLAMLENNRRHRDDVRLFEIGKGYRPEAASARGEPRELHELALVWCGVPPRGEPGFEQDRFTRLHGVVSDLLARVGAPALSWERGGNPPSWAHPARCLEGRLEDRLEELDGELVVTLAGLEPGLARALGLDDELASETACAEISVDALVHSSDKRATYQPIARFPGVKLDVAVDLPEATHAAELVTAIGRAGKGQVFETVLFDVYRGKNVGEGRKSLAYHVLLQSEKKTLTDKDQAKFLMRLEQNLEAIDGRLRR